MLTESYLAADVKEELVEAFMEQGFVRLTHFLELEAVVPLAHGLWHAKGKQYFQANLHSFLQIPVSTHLRTVFTGPLMKGFLGSVLGRKVRNIQLSVRRFGPGDFTLIHDSRNTRGVCFYYLLSGTWNSLWGGTLTIQREKAPALFFPLESNTFSLISFEKGMHPFVQYINHLAGKESFLLVEGIVS